MFMSRGKRNHFGSYRSTNVKLKELIIFIASAVSFLFGIVGIQKELERVTPSRYATRKRYVDLCFQPHQTTQRPHSWPMIFFWYRIVPIFGAILPRRNRSCTQQRTMDWWIPASWTDAIRLIRPWLMQDGHHSSWQSRHHFYLKKKDSTDKHAPQPQKALDVQTSNPDCISAP